MSHFKLWWSGGARSGQIESRLGSQLVSTRESVGSRCRHAKFSCSLTHGGAKRERKMAMNGATWTVT